MSFSYEPPKGWRFPTIEEIAPDKGAIRIGPFGSALKKHEYSDAGIRVLGIEDVFPNRLDSTRRKFIPESKFRELSQYTVRAGDLLVTNMGTVGRTCVVPDDLEKSIISSHLIKISLDLDVAWPTYIAWMLNFCPLVVAQIEAKCHGAIMAGFNSGLLKELQIPLPPLPEQRRIAAMLDRAEALRAKRRAALARLDTLTQSIFLDMFGDPATNPKGWRVTALGNVATTTSGGTPDRTVAEYFGGGIPWVKSGELHQGLITETEETLSQRGLAESSAKRVPSGTVLVAMYEATVGAVALLGVEATTNQAVCCIQPAKELLADYLLHLVKRLAPSLLSKRVGGAQPNLSQDLIRKLLIPMPPVEIQRDFVGRTDAVERLRADQRMSRASLDTLFSSLQDRAFRGEL